MRMRRLCVAHSRTSTIPRQERRCRRRLGAREPKRLDDRWRPSAIEFLHLAAQEHYQGRLLDREAEAMGQQAGPVAPHSRSPDANEDADVRDILPAWPGIEIWELADRGILKRQVLGIIGRFGRYTRVRAGGSVVQSADRTTTALVIDPALLMESGHNYSTLLRLKADLSKFGVQHTSFASVTADPVVRKVAAPVLPTR